MSRKGKLTVGVIATGLVVALVAILVIHGWSAWRAEEGEHLCQMNLRNQGRLLRYFSEENGGLFPELSSRPGFLSMKNMSDGYKTPLVPNYFSGEFPLLCPLSERWKTLGDKFTGTPQDLLDESDYIYFGYAIKNEKELEAFQKSYQQRIAAGLPFNEDLPVPPGTGSGGGDKLLRLRNDVEEAYLKGASDPDEKAGAHWSIPVLIERPGNHTPSGLNVLYMDGHVKFLRYPGEWPATERTFEIVKQIEAMRQAETVPATASSASTTSGE